MSANTPPAVEVDIGKLKWRCRRGMRELDALMRAYLDGHYAQASSEEQVRFLELIDMQDPELFALVTGKRREARYQDIVEKMHSVLSDNS